MPSCAIIARVDPSENCSFSFLAGPKDFPTDTFYLKRVEKTFRYRVIPAIPFPVILHLDNHDPSYQGVRQPGYGSSENNAAERAIRPAVVARKISGGTRSARGSNTASVLRSLFETWALQGRNTIDACREMITLAAKAQHSPAR